jgi:hypothetical protein
MGLLIAIFPFVYGSFSYSYYEQFALSNSFLGRLDRRVHLADAPPPVLAEIDQQCSLAVQWQPLMQYVQDDLINSYTDITNPFAYENFLDPEAERKSPEAYLKDGGIGYRNMLPQFELVIQGPPPLVFLSKIPDPKILDELVELLDVPGRAWAAHVLLSKLLGQGSVTIFNPDQPGVEFVGQDLINYWWETEGKTGKAKQNLQIYLQKVKPTLEWRSDPGYYRHIRPNGTVVEFCPRATTCYIPEKQANPH